MKIKSLIAILLSLIFVLGLTACQESNITIDGGDTYYYSSVYTSSDEISSEVNSNDVSSNETSSQSKNPIDWETVEDGEEPFMFFIKNSMDIEIIEVGYRPVGAKKYKMTKIEIDTGEVKPIEFSQGDIIRYRSFEFKFVAYNGKVAELNALKVDGKKGLELLYMNGGYSHKYIK